MNISESELVAAIQQAWEEHRTPEDEVRALTRQEIEDATGWGRAKCHTIIRSLVQSGQWEHVQVRRMLVDGRVRRTAAYRPVEEDVAGTGTNP